MVVNNTNISALKCCYLDLNISIYQEKFRVALYDKRKDYNFKFIFKLAALRNKFVKFYKSKLNIWGKYGSDIYDEFIEMFQSSNSILSFFSYKYTVPS